MLLGSELHDDTAHPGGFKLEHARPWQPARRSFLRHVRVVIRRDISNLKARRLCFAIICSAWSITERLRRPKKVHLEQTELLPMAVMVYCVTRRIVVHCAAARNRTTGRSVMTTPAACVDVWRGMPSNFARHVEKLVHLLVCFRTARRSSCDAFSALSIVIFKLHGHKLCDAVAPLCTESPSRAQRRGSRAARRHGAEGDDLRHVVGAVFVA